MYNLQYIESYHKVSTQFFKGKFYRIMVFIYLTFPCLHNGRLSKLKQKLLEQHKQWIHIIKFKLDLMNKVEWSLNDLKNN